LEVLSFFNLDSISNIAVLIYSLFSNDIRMPVMLSLRFLPEVLNQLHWGGHFRT